MSATILFHISMSFESRHGKVGLYQTAHGRLSATRRRLLKSSSVGWSSLNPESRLSASPNSLLLVECRWLPICSYPFGCVAEECEDCLWNDLLVESETLKEELQSQSTHTAPITNVSSPGTCSYTIGFPNARVAQPVSVEDRDDREAIVAELMIQTLGRALSSQLCHPCHSVVLSSHFRAWLASRAWFVMCGAVKH